jgi:hypothetical protein
MRIWGFLHNISACEKDLDLLDPKKIIKYFKKLYRMT